MTGNVLENVDKTVPERKEKKRGEKRDYRVSLKNLSGHSGRGNVLGNVAKTVPERKEKKRGREIIEYLQKI